MRDCKQLYETVVQAEGIHGRWSQYIQDLCQEEYITEKEYKEFLNDLYSAIPSDATAKYVANALKNNPPRHV